MTNKSRLIFATGAMLVGAFALAGMDGQAANNEDARIKRRLAQAHQIWDEWLTKNIADGDDLRRIDEKLKGSYRDRATHVTGGSGDQIVLYQIDSYFQLYLAVDHENKLVIRPKLYPLENWIKLPGGKLLGTEKMDGPNTHQPAPQKK